MLSFTRMYKIIYVHNSHSKPALAPILFTLTNGVLPMLYRMLGIIFGCGRLKKIFYRLMINNNITIISYNNITNNTIIV